MCSLTPCILTTNAERSSYLPKAAQLVAPVVNHLLPHVMINKRLKAHRQWVKDGEDLRQL